jgi:hypothetical protein
VESVVSVTDYLERAREAAALAERMPNERARLLEIAEAWLKLADETAKEAANEAAKKAAKPNGRPPE